MKTGLVGDARKATATNGEPRSGTFLYGAEEGKRRNSKTRGRQEMWRRRLGREEDVCAQRGGGRIASKRSFWGEEKIRRAENLPHTRGRIGGRCDAMAPAAETGNEHPAGTPAPSPAGRRTLSDVGGRRAGGTGFEL